METEKRSVSEFGVSEVGVSEFGDTLIFGTCIAVFILWLWGYI